VGPTLLQRDQPLYTHRTDSTDFITDAEERHFPSFEEHADGTNEHGSCDLLLVLYCHLKPRLHGFWHMEGRNQKVTKPILSTLCGHTVTLNA